MTKETYDLYYWPGLPGRGEFIRLVFEEAGVPYRDMGRLPEEQGGGMNSIMQFYKGNNEGHPVFAPPVVTVGELVVAQMPNICLFLGRRFNLAPEYEAGWLLANQLQLTIADLVNEVHDTHHPLGITLYYEDQLKAAKQRSELFLDHRLPRFLGYFQRVLDFTGGEVLVGDRTSYVDLSFFHVMRGLAHAFPRAFARESEKIPGLIALRDRVAARPNIAAYLVSERCQPFTEDGIFRAYPDLDAE